MIIWSNISLQGESMFNKSSEVVDSIKDITKLSSVELPSYFKIMENITPVLNINPRKCLITRGVTSSVTGANTVYQILTNQKFYLNTVTLSVSNDAACTATFVSFRYYQDNVLRDISFSFQTLTAREFHHTIIFPVPIELDAGSIIYMRLDFGAGNATKFCHISGFYL